MEVVRQNAAKYAAVSKKRFVDTVLLYIENHLSGEINPENIAERFFCSPSQLYRDFYAFTGHSVMEYIRKRRMSNACEKIKYSDMPLAIIANESGYQTQQAFNKQFKNIVSMKPLEYKQSDTFFYFYPFAINEISLTVKVGAETIPEWTTTRFYDSRLPGIEDRAIAMLGKKGEIKGRVFGHNGKQIGNKFCYEIMTPVTGCSITDAPLLSKTDLYATVNEK